MDGSKTFGLAPMEGVSELPFRLWLAQLSSPAFTSTPFLRATDTFPSPLQIPLDFAPESIRDWDVPYELVPQVMASHPEDFVRTARIVLPAAHFVDLNCGCPSPNPVSGGAGSSLLKETKIFSEFAARVSAELAPGTFSIKMRTGFNDTDSFEAMIASLSDLPLRQLTVHGRTRADRYDSSSRWDLIQRAATSLKFPVVGSGDILGIESARALMKAAPAVSRLIVGRGALRNPWIFQELRDGQPVMIRRSILQYAIASFALLTELGLNHQIDRLEPLVRDGLWRQQAGHNLEALSAFYAQLGYALVGRAIPFAELELDRITLGRVKMVWNYIRSSLPEPYFEPLLLRSKSLGELLDGLQRLDPADEPFAITHRPEWDWLYTSSRQKSAPASL